MIDLHTITVPRLIHAMEARGHAVFRSDGQPFNLNIVGVRHRGRESNRFDDAIAAFWRYRGEWHLRRWRVTTDPGTHFLLRPLRAEGTAILAAGQYRGVYRIDLHAGRYEALCQRLGAVKVYRDNNRDSTLDLDPRKHHVGWFGINIHRANPSGITALVNRHSAGCQVFQDATDFEEFMGLCRSARSRWGDKFTYTLLHEEHLPPLGRGGA
jgi:hypothetical protein